FDAARRAWRPSGDPVQDGCRLARLARDHGCGYSVGITRWTDSTLHVTLTPETRKLIVLGPRSGPAARRPTFARATKPQEHARRWRGVCRGAGPCPRLAQPVGQPHGRLGPLSASGSDFLPALPPPAAAPTRPRLPARGAAPQSVPPSSGRPGWATPGTRSIAPVGSGPCP